MGSNLNRINLKKIVKENPFLLAPMDDVTDIAFRELSEKKGASYTTSELTSVEALNRDKVIKSRFQRGDLKINSVQLFGSNPDSFLESIKRIDDEADIIDLNFGCPSPSVNSNNSGAILLKDPKNIGNIIDKIIKNSDKPLTAKIRLGYKNVTYLEVAKEIEDAGVELLTVHGRTAEQKYSGKANWNAIKEIFEKKNNSLILIGNGDIKSEEDIDKYLKSHADGLMIGRAAIGDPEIFERFNYYYKNNKKIEYKKSLKERKKELFLEYIDILSKYDFLNPSLKIQRQSMWFMKGIEGSRELRKEIMKNREISKIIELVKRF